MSMIGNFFRTDDKTVRDLQTGKLLLGDLLYNEECEVDDDCFIDIDKSWHAIHFILSGEVWEASEDPLSKVILNGNELNDEDMGYGPAMLVGHDDIHNINNALKSVSEEWFRKRFSISNMLKNEIYPVVDDEDEDDFFQYVYEYFKLVKEFYEEAEKENQCVLFFIC